VEFGETLEAACLRELKEETGIDATIDSLIDVSVGPHQIIEYKNGDRVAYMDASYLCRALGDQEPARSEEASEVGYFTLEEIEALDLMRWMRVMLPIIRKKIGGG